MSGLALYGAIVGTVSIVLGGGSLAWQIYSWRQDRRTRVAVRLANGFLGGGAVQALLTITAVNYSAHPVTVNSVGLESQDGSKQWALLPMVPGSTIPGVIKARDSGSTWVVVEDASRVGLDLFKPLIGRVDLSTGQTFQSKRTVLRKP